MLKNDWIMWARLDMDNTPVQWKELFEALEDQLQQASERNENRINHLKECLVITRGKVEELKARVHDYSFSSPEEEIRFFKFIKPAFYSRLIYYLKLFGMETSSPAGSPILQEGFLTATLQSLNHYFAVNGDFYRYYKSGDTYLDRNYFTRGVAAYYPNLDDTYFSYDASFSTSHDLQVARIIAYEELIFYVTRKLSESNTEDTVTKRDSLHHPTLEWTATKVGLIELLYALQSTGTFNNGSSDLKQLASYFERAFRIQLGNYYNVFQEMRLRKKNRTNFLDLLKERLLKRIDDADERL